MAKSKELGFECFLIKKCGEVVPWKELTREEIEKVKKGWAERLSRTMSAYYSVHSEEYEQIKESLDEQII